MKYLIFLLSVLILTSCGGGSTNVQPQAPSLTSKSVSGSNVVYIYNDGSTVTKGIVTRLSVSWASDHITRTTNYSLSDGTTDSVTDSVAAVVSKSYNINTQTVTNTYGDGHVTTSTNTATSNVVSWATDHITKTVTYTFPDTTTNPDTSTEQPTLTSSYSGSVQTVTSTYGDGYISTVANSPTISSGSWDSNAELNITHTYSDSSSNIEVKDFGWVDYVQYTPNQSFSFDATGGMIYMNVDYNGGSNECCISGSTIDQNFVMTVKLNASHQLESGQQTNTLGVKDSINWTSGGWGTTFFYTGSNADLIPSDARGDTTLIIMSSNPSTNMSVEHLVFGAWNCLYCLDDNNVEKIIAGAFYGPDESRLSGGDLPNSGSYTFSGKSIGYRHYTTSSTVNPKSAYRSESRDFSLNVDFGNSTISYANGDNTISDIDFTGSSAIQADGSYGGTISFLGGKTGTLEGHFFGAGALNAGGVFKRSDNGYIGGFGASKQ